MFGCRAYRTTHARISAASLFGFLGQVSEPRIVGLGGKLAEIELGAIGQGNAGHRLAGRLLGLRDHLADAWFARHTSAMAGAEEIGLCGRLVFVSAGT